MRRRDFISLVGSATIVRPIVASAQARVPLVGVLIANVESDPDGQARKVAFQSGLSALGWMEGRNIEVDYRWGVADPGRTEPQIADLVARSPDVIVSAGTLASSAVQRATKVIPIVFVVVIDPVSEGLVRTMARPGGNITGFSTFEPEIGGKWLELLREVSPDVLRIGVLSDPDFKGAAALWRSLERLSNAMGMRATVLPFANPALEVDPVIGPFAEEKNSGLIVIPTAANNVARKKIVSASARFGVPAIYPFRQYSVEGGLISYGVDVLDLFKKGASYVDRILKGEKPADLPVQAPTKYELAINLRTAKALGITVQPSLLARADEVIE
jgi:putative tryptophan/tyrosine transport system substrate-binding protein